MVEDTDFTRDDIEVAFGKKIADIVEGLTKISGGIFGDKASIQAENFRKLLLSMSSDVRVVLIKMADRLHNMRTLGSMRPESNTRLQERLFISTLPSPTGSVSSRLKWNLKILPSNMSIPQNMHG